MDKVVVVQMPRDAAIVWRPGLPINLAEVQGRFEISVLPGLPGPLGHEVVAVGEDYVAVRDVAGVAETVIPLYSIKCVKTFRQPR